jgi:hypothetical protein
MKLNYLPAETGNPSPPPAEKITFAEQMSMDISLWNKHILWRLMRIDGNAAKPAMKSLEYSGPVILVTCPKSPYTYFNGVGYLAKPTGASMDQIP